MSYQDIPATFRPITLWPGAETRERKSAAFSAAWQSTLELLKRELRMLDARRVVVEIAMHEGQIRRDGYPYSNARATHPGVILSFESKYGPLRYPCDTYTRWEDNLRAIALALEALRAVDRYGVTRRAEQYAGWKALPAGGGSAERGRELIRQHGGVRAALLATHPDQGGTVEDFAAVQAARGEVA